jgi:hypothetical protein
MGRACAAVSNPPGKHIRKMEASMHGSLDNQPNDSKKDVKSVYRAWDIKLVALPILIVIALIGMAITHPSASKWVSDAVQAEFIGTDFVPDLAPPTRVVQPTNEIRTVKAY